MTQTLTRRALGRATLARQLLLAREEIAPVEAVERLCGLQAQEAKPPFVGLWTRLAGFRADDLHAALHERLIVRATLMRATLHMLSARDYAALRSALQPAISPALVALGDRAAGLDLERLLPVARTVLEERPHAFAELRDRLQEAFPDVNERALGYAVRLHLPLVMVPTEDRWAFPPASAFTLADGWLGEPLSPDDAPDALVSRYLAAFGPATPADFQVWSGIKGARAAFDRMRERLDVVRDERGRDLFDLPGALRPGEDVPAPARYLPEFDNLVLSHADRTRVLAEEDRGRVVTRNLRVRATFLWDGSVAGLWSVERKRAAATLRLAPFRGLPSGATDELAAEGEALLRFLEPEAVTVSIAVDAP